MSSASQIALVVGASGGIGSETALAFSRHGWKIRAFSRTKGSASGSSGWEWVKGDALDRASVLAASQGVRAIVHAVNPPGYRNWDKLILPMIDNTIAAGKASGARILLPGTIYNYGPDAFPVLREESPQNATTRKGKVRVELEKRLKDAARQGVHSLIVRFGDFFGPKPGNNWFSQSMVHPNRPLKSITYPGKNGVGHDWAYLPDAGEAFAQLMERDGELEDFASFHFRGLWDKDGTEMVAAIRRVTGKRSLAVKALPWFLFKLASPFNETLRELYATRPLWTTPIQLDNARLVRLLGRETNTDLDLAVETTLRALGCLTE